MDRRRLRRNHIDRGGGRPHHQPVAPQPCGDAWYLLSSIGRDKAVALRVDWKTDAQTLVASHDKVDIAGCLADARTDEVTAVSAEYVRSEWIAVDPGCRT